MNPYDDIIDLPHHVSKTRPQMDEMNRAAQFAPFAALTGHGDNIRETARLTDRQIEPDESVIAELDEKFRRLRDHIQDHPQVMLVYFQPDPLKEGGTYLAFAGAVKKIDEARRKLVFQGGQEIDISLIYDINEI